MKKKIFAAMLAAGIVLSSCTFAGAQEAVDDADTAAPDTIGGYYIENYAKAAEQVNLNIISETDLLAAAQEAGTVIYNFRDDSSVEIFSTDGYEQGTYETADNTLTITCGDAVYEYKYEFIDGLLVIRSGDESSILYGFAVEDLEHVFILDYSEIEIDENSVAVSEEMIDSYIDSVLQGQTTTEKIEEGIVEDGDIITISFEGILEGEEEPFEGGTSEGITLQVGSGALIEGFEEQLTGKEVGTAFDVSVTFPEDYSGSEGLAGRNAVFSTTILSKTLINTPELTDEWVRDFSGKYLPETLETVDDFREYSREYLGEYLLHTAMLNALAAKTQITAYNSALSSMLLNYSAANLANTAAMYGYDADSYASLFGYDTADAYEQAEAVSYMNIAMIANKVLSDQGILYTSDELNNGLEGYLRLSASPYTIDEYKEKASAADMWVYTNLEYKYNLAMESLEDRVVLTEETETQAAE